MNPLKSAHAGVKEKIQNVAAKVDEMTALNKASASAKAERKEAENKADKHDAKADYHTKQAEILREYEQKKANNAAEKEQKKTAVNQKKADKHTSKADKHTNKADKHTNKADKHANATGAIVGDGKIDDNAEQLTTAPERLSGARGDDMNATDPVDVAGSGPVHHSEVPMQGSGVPTHSTLHSDNIHPANDTHDVRTTQTMEGSPNNGSYM